MKRWSIRDTLAAQEEARKWPSMAKRTGSFKELAETRTDIVGEIQANRKMLVSLQQDVAEMKKAIQELRGEVRSIAFGR